MGNWLLVVIVAHTGRHTGRFPTTTIPLLLRAHHSDDNNPPLPCTYPTRNVTMAASLHVVGSISAAVPAHAPYPSP